MARQRFHLKPGLTIIPVSRPPAAGGFFLRPAEPDDFPLAASALLPTVGPSMITPETFSHLENIKKRAGYLWRFL